MLRTEAEPYRRMLHHKKTELEMRLRYRGPIEIEREPDLMDDLRLAAERDLAIQSLEREAALLRQVRLALERIEYDDYGVCVVCHRPISPNRLAAVPWAEKCVHCQEVSDAKASLRRSGPPNGVPDAA